jgi:hypothetical protein
MPPAPIMTMGRGNLGRGDFASRKEDCIRDSKFAFIGKAWRNILRVSLSPLWFYE